MRTFLSFLIVIPALGCGSRQVNETKVITGNIPKELNFQVTKQAYNSFNGNYDVAFDVTNTGKKKFDYPSFHAEMYKAGKIVAEADGGAQSALTSGETGSGTFHQIFPDGRPDSVIVKPVF